MRLASLAVMACLLATGCRREQHVLRTDRTSWDQAWWGSDRKMQSGQTELGSVPARSAH